jgi:hypothetical protein
MLLLLLSVIPSPALAGTGMFSLDEGDDTFVDPVEWMRIPAGQMILGLLLGLSIFELVVVYRGGRSNHACFNDRALADDNSFKNLFFSLKAALSGAVFNFLLSVFLPIPIPYTRRYP